MQAVADLDVLDLAEPAVDVHDELTELFGIGAFGQTKIMV